MIKDLITIAKEAGEIIREGFGKNFSIEFKTNESNLVTEIDKKSEKHIIDFITKKYPGNSMLTEESGEHNRHSEYVWVVDPLDGTSNFAHNLPIFSVSIGLQKSGVTIAGVVFDVMRNEMYTAELGSGAYCNDAKITVNQNDILRRSFLVTGFPYNIEENPDNAIELFVEMIKRTRAVRRLGSAAIDFCCLAKGIFDGFWEVSLHPWDIAAGKLIVEEAGGIVTNFSGEKIDIFSKQILASNGKMHQPLLGVIKSVKT